MSKINLFIPEDFKPLTGDTSISLSHASIIANDKLQKLIEESINVYCYDKDNPNYLWFRGSDKTGIRNYKAKLMFIEEMPKEPCKHEPNDVTVFLKKSTSEEFVTISVASLTNIATNKNKKCKHCGVELKAKWEAV